MADSLDFLEAIEADPGMTGVEKARAALAVSSIQLAAADVPQAMRAARLALHYSAVKDARQEEVAAHSLLAAMLALCGHYRSAQGHLTAAKEIEEKLEAGDTSGEEEQQALECWPMVFAELLLGAQHGGLEFGAELAEIPLEPSTNTIVGGYRLYRDVVGRMIQGDFLAARSHCELHRSHPDHENSTQLFNHLLLGAEALCLLQTERPGAVLSLLSEAEAPPSHFVPYGALIANAYILLGSPQKALDALAVGSGARAPWCASAKASTLLREAVAKEMLGDHRGADLAFFRAAQLADTEDGAVPPIGLPLPILEALSNRTAAAHPEIMENLVTGSFSKFEVRHAESPPCNCADLTPRELELAEQLSLGKTFNEIAEETFRSANTLKGQARSLYKKLEVDSREEAITVLERAGFFT